MLNNDIAVEVKNLTVWYQNQNEPVLRNISFRLARGEVLLVYGKSGSGKTTLLRAITGTIGKIIGGRVNGKIRLYGLDPYNTSPRTLLKLIGYVPQEPWYSIIAPTTWGELILNQLLIEEYDEDFINKVLEHYSLHNLRNRLTYTLSAGETQRLIIASSIVRKAKILLLDEPTSFLDEEHRHRLVSYIRRVINNDVTVIVVDHNIELWANIVDKILVLDRGLMKYFGKPDGLEKEYPFNVHLGSIGRILRPGKEFILNARNIWYRYPGSNEYVLKGIDLQVRKGEFLWIKGPNGSGKTTLLKILSGILKPSRGIVYKHSKVIYIPENPLLYFSEPTIADEVGFSRKAKQLLELVGLSEIAQRKLRFTSSGERRRAAIASAIARGYSIICLDEPTAGLDPFSKKNVIEALIHVVNEEKATIIVASHDDIFKEIATSIIELKGGELR